MKLNQKIRSFVAKLLIGCLLFIIGIPYTCSFYSREVYADNKELNLISIEDTYVRGGNQYKDKNYGLENIMELKTSDLDNYRKGYMKFDLSSLDNSVVVNKAVLTLNAWGQGNPLEVGLYETNDSWSEGDITWNTAPNIDSEASVKIGMFNITNTSVKPYAIDLTDYIKTKVKNGEKVISIGLDCITVNKNAKIYTKEDAGGRGPKLDISYNTEDISQPTATKTPEQTATNAPEPTTAVESDGIKVFTPVADTYIRSQKYSSENYGTEETLLVKNATAENDRKSFLKFDLDQLSNSFEITQAKLILYGKGTGVDVSIVKIVDDSWEESQITWDNAPTIPDEELATVTLTNNSNFKAYEIDVTNYLCEQAVPGDDIVSFALVGKTKEALAYFSSKENPNNMQAELIVEYVEAGPRILNSIPHNGGKLFTDSSAYIDFDTDVDKTTITDKENIIITPSIDYELQYDENMRRCNILFPNGIPAGDYTICLRAGVIHSKDGKPMVSDKTISFSSTEQPWDTDGIILTQHIGSAYADATLTNNTNVTSEATIILGLYNKDKTVLIDFTTMQYNIEAGETRYIQTPIIDIPEETEEYTLKSYLWNNMQEMRSIAPPVEADNFQEYDAMRDKAKTLLTGGSYYDLENSYIIKNIEKTTQEAQELWTTLDKSEERTGLWPSLSLGSNSARLTTTYDNLKLMATAYATVGSELYRNKELLHDIIESLDWLEQNVYNAEISKYGNWWDWEIGVPLRLSDCIILIYDDLTREQKVRYMDAIAHFQPSITMTGANRAWECEIFMARGIILKDPEVLEMVRTEFMPLLEMKTSGDGFYEDGSFIQHNCFAYNGGYGKNIFHSITNILYVMNDSAWDIDDVEKNKVYSWVQNSFEPFIYKGAFMDMVRGREISRSYAESHYVGHSIMNDILRLSQICSEEFSIQFQSMVKYWIEAGAVRSFYDDASNDTIMLAESVMNDLDIVSRGEKPQYRQFYHMDRAVQIRPGYGVGISMFSDRIANYEMINEENIKGYHTGDGMLYLYNNDLLQYSDDFWPTVNKYRLPGTTVLHNGWVSANLRSDQSWVGGVQFEDLFGVSGMQLHTPGTDLYAKKSWFMFDNEIVALGADIHSTEANHVETIIENRKIDGDNQFVVNGIEKSIEPGWSETIHDSQWAHLQGNVEGADIGYYFPESTEMQFLRETRTGSWAEMRKAESSEKISANYLTMWFDHGEAPIQGSYSYVLLPNMSKEKTQEYAANPDIIIIENSEHVQAVKDTKLCLIGANFWSDSLQTVDKITCDKKASVMMSESEEELSIAVSDPTQLNTESIHIEIAQSAEKVIVHDDNITVEQLSPTIKLSVHVDNSKGKSYQAKFSLL